MYYLFSHQSFYEDCEKKNGDNVLKSSGKTVKLTNSNHLKEKQPRNGMVFLLKHSLNVCSTLHFILIRKRTCTRGQCLVLLVHGFPSFLMKLPNVSDNYVKFIPVETVVPWRVNCIYQNLHCQSMKAGMPLAASASGWKQLYPPPSVLTAFASRN